MKYIDEARQVLNDEARALQLLAESLGEEFEKTIDCLLGISGRIAVTGMGKSGHVARKIAATLASTGSPAFFIFLRFIARSISLSISAGVKSSSLRKSFPLRKFI